MPTTPSAGRRNLPGFRSASRNRPLARQPAITLQPQTYHDLNAGVGRLAALVRPTLGPLPRMVALARGDSATPEILDNGALIARRMIQISPRGQDVGAMLLRHALWRMHQEAGDGSTTMAVMHQVIMDEGIRAVVQGGCNAMLLAGALHKGLQLVRETLQQEARPLQGKENIARFARGLVRDNSELANILGEVFDIVGSDGLVVVEKGARVGLEREYIEGTYWQLSGWFSSLFAGAPVTPGAPPQAVFEDAALLLSDLAIDEPGQLAPVLEQCVRAGVRKLVVIAKEIPDRVIGLLVKNNQAQTIATLAVRTPQVLEMDRVAALEDIAMLAGGRVFYAAAYADFCDFQIADLGRARRAWATPSLFGLFGGKGDPRRIRRHINDLRGRLRLAVDEHEKEQLRQRLGRVSGGTAILRVAEATDSASEALKQMAQRAATTLRHALEGGVAPGGGTALLRAQSALAAAPGAGFGDAARHHEAIAYNILRRALEEPLRTIAHNAGCQPDSVVGRVKAAAKDAKDHGFDARNGQIVDMKQAGVLDSVFILQKALEIAVSSAAQALTTDVLVHHKKPQECVEP